MSKLDALGEQLRTTISEIERLDARIAESALLRPTAEMAQTAWSELPKLWDHASEQQRQDLMAAIVKEVILKQKSSDFPAFVIRPKEIGVQSSEYFRNWERGYTVFRTILHGYHH